MEGKSAVDFMGQKSASRSLTYDKSGTTVISDTDSEDETGGGSPGDETANMSIDDEVNILYSNSCILYTVSP